MVASGEEEVRSDLAWEEVEEAPLVLALAAPQAVVIQISLRRELANRGLIAGCPSQIADVEEPWYRKG